MNALQISSAFGQQSKLAQGAKPSGRDAPRAQINVGETNE